MKNIRLAIVIPYYKITFFEETLKSLVYQTNKQFNVYIGNDASPEDPSFIIEKYKKKLNIKYKKYSRNLGGKSLIKHINRCLDLVEYEDWILVLPDDDMLGVNIVENFYKYLKLEKKNSIKVFRFPLILVNEQNKVIYKKDYTKNILETNLQFYNKVLRGKSSATLGNNIFNKKALLDSDGFVEFEKGWNSDHATILNVSKNGKIFFIKDALFYLRKSNINISSDKTDGLFRINASISFVNWLKNNESIFPENPDDNFYKHFYWKREYCFIYYWKFSFKVLLKLIKLHKICFNNFDFCFVCKILYKKLYKN